MRLLPNTDKVVGETGFEPATPWSQTRCATSLRHSPTGLPLSAAALPRKRRAPVQAGGARWARRDSNPQPSRYERPALTVELQAPAATA